MQIIINGKCYDLVNGKFNIIEIIEMQTFEINYNYELKYFIYMLPINEFIQNQNICIYKLNEVNNLKNSKFISLYEVFCSLYYLHKKEANVFLISNAGMDVNSAKLLRKFISNESKVNVEKLFLLINTASSNVDFRIPNPTTDEIKKPKK